MLILEFSSQKECSKIRGKAWFSSWSFLVCWTLHRSRISLGFKKIRYCASQCYSIHVVYKRSAILQTLVVGLFETFDIIQFIGQIEASSFNSWALGTFVVPGEGNLMIRVFRGMGKSIPTHRGIYFSSWPIGSVAKGAHIKLSAVFEGIFIYLFIYFYGSCFEYMEMFVFTIKSIPCDDLIDMPVKSSERPWMYGTQ